MAISFCGIPLLLHDPDGALAGHIDRYLAEEETAWFGEQTAAEVNHERESTQRHPARVAMPAFNWPKRPQPRINTFYYPVTGATRWSVGLFLVDGKTWGKIQKGWTMGALARWPLATRAREATPSRRLTR